MIKIYLEPIFGWGWHMDDRGFDVPPPFSLRVLDSNNKLHPQKSYTGAVIEDNHVLSNWDIELMARGDPLLGGTYILSASPNRENKDVSAASMIVGYIILEKII